MKLLFDPVYTNKSIARCATYYALHEMARFAVRRIPDSFAYIVAPSNVEIWDLDDLDPDERIRYVKLPFERDRYKELLYLERGWLEKFAYFGEFFDWDAMVTTRVPSLMQMRLAVERSGHMKKIVAFEPFPIVEFKKTVSLFYVYDDPQLLTLGGYMSSDVAAVNTKHEIDGILSTAKKMLSPAKWLQLKEKLNCKYILPLGVDPAIALKKRVKKDKTPRIVIYPQRLDNTERRPEMVMETLQYAFVGDALRDGTPIEFEVYTNSAAIGGWAEKFEFVRFQQPLREEFYRKLQQSDVFISFAIEEGLPLSLLEALCFGVIGVVKREPWSEDMFGVDYPWLIGNPQEAVAAIRTICDDYQKAYARFRKWLKEDFIPRMEGLNGLAPISPISSSVKYGSCAYTSTPSKLNAGINRSVADKCGTLKSAL